MAEHSWDKDDRPHIYKKVLDSDILVRSGIPADGSQRSAWTSGCRFDYPNPKCR
jgi:hypothetical protein